MGDFPSYLCEGSPPLATFADIRLPGRSEERLCPAKARLKAYVSRLQCTFCSADLCFTSQIISKGFTGRHGRAYLVSATPTARANRVGVEPTSTSLPNTREQRIVPRQLVTGEHTVSDICCDHCGSVLGWKYASTEEESQQYKVGKFILETKRINRTSCWESITDVAVRNTTGIDGVEDVEFDSQDDEECDDLFSGLWSPTSAAQRRENR